MLAVEMLVGDAVIVAVFVAIGIAILGALATIAYVGYKLVQALTSGRDSLRPAKPCKAERGGGR
jgi:hypothetical protein